jgi:hypothetical protein
MTDYSARYAEQPEIEDDVLVELKTLRSDAEIIELTTKSLYPNWTPAPNGKVDPQLEDGRQTWCGIIDELSGTRSA